MNSQKGIVGCLLLACTLQMSAQVKTYKYRVNFRDKAETTYALDKPSAYLSERALERRMKQGLPVDSTDIPVCRSYIDMLVGKGAQLVSKSKWNNTVVVQVSDTSVIDKVAALPFVTAVRKVWIPRIFPFFSMIPAMMFPLPIFLLIFSYIQLFVMVICYGYTLWGSRHRSDIPAFLVQSIPMNL